MLNLISDCRGLERRLAGLRREKDTLQNEIAECEKSLSLLLFQIEEIRRGEVDARQPTADAIAAVFGAFPDLPEGGAQ
jgi:hypothetical protein